jgi:hypothetical protein
MDIPEDSQAKGDLVLTSIRSAYTLSTTPEDTGEVDTVMVNNFLHALAEIAVNIAARRKNNEQDNGLQAN